MESLWPQLNQQMHPALSPHRTVPLLHASSRTLSTPNLRQRLIIFSVFPPPT